MAVTFERIIDGIDGHRVYVSVDGEHVYIADGGAYEPAIIHHSNAKQLADAIMEAATRAAAAQLDKSA